MVRKTTRSANPARPFGQGIELEPLAPVKPARRRFEPSAEDRQWAAMNLNRDCADYFVNPPPISGGAPAPAELALADNDRDASTWPAWTDSYRYSPTPDGVNVDDLFTELMTFDPSGSSLTSQGAVYNARPDDDDAVTETMARLWSSSPTDDFEDHQAWLDGELDDLLGSEEVAENDHPHGAFLGHPA